MRGWNSATSGDPRGPQPRSPHGKEEILTSRGREARGREARVCQEDFWKEREMKSVVRRKRSL